MKKIKRILVTQSAQNYPKTVEIVNRAKTSFKIKDIIYLNNDKAEFPKGNSRQQNFEYMKETLVLTTRKATPFVTTFASPGNIVENLGTILTLNWHCSFNCQFCYLIGSSFQRPWQEAFVNIDEMERQIILEKFIHSSILTVWSLVSEFQNSALVKIPDNLKETADWIRKRFIKLNIDSDKKAIAFIKENFEKIFTQQMGIESFDDKLVNKVTKFYNANKKFSPWLNISEYTDFLAIDPLTNFSLDLVKILDRHPELNISLRTKSANVDDLLTLKATSNIKISMNFNTKHAIDNYEIGSATLDERIAAAKKIQSKSGVLLKVIVEPIIAYDNYENDYVDLIERLKKELNLSSVENITFGCVRYKNKLISMINEFYPNTKLDLASNLVAFPKDRIRYEEQLRKNIYSKILTSLNGINTKLQLAAETPQMWDDLALKKEDHISLSVAQHK